MKSNGFVHATLAALSAGAAMLVVTAVVYQGLPEMIPMHWGVDGQVDGWYPKLPFAFMMPGVSVLIALLMGLLPRIDPEGKNYARFKGSYAILQVGIALFIALIQIPVLLVALGFDLPVAILVKAGVALLFLVIGNLMPRMKPNWFVGIKTPWTIKSTEVWAKTHRHGGFVWVPCSLGLLGCAFMDGLPSALGFLVLILVMVIEPAVYSWVWWNRLETKKLSG